jgi:hypothetical protein
MAIESRLRFALQTLGKLENGIRIRDLTEQELIVDLDKKLQNAVVDRGILCFHNSGTLFGGANFTSEMKPSATSSLACFLCPFGTFSNSTGATNISTCTQCLPGTKSSTLNQ